MEMFLSRLLTALGWLFIPVWLTGVIGGILFGIRSQKGPPEKEQAEKMGKCFGIMAAAYIFSVMGVSLLSDQVRVRAWKTMMAQHPSRLIIQAPEGSASLEITNRVAIDQLLTIVVNAKHVSAHHSHDIPEVTLYFPEFARTGSIGRDSEKQHEFWGPLGQFKSEELEQWLQKYWLPRR